MYRSAKYLLQPTKGQARKLDHLLSVHRDLYNAALGERIGAWEQERRTVTKFDQFGRLRGLAETNPALAQYGHAPARGTLTMVDAAFQAFFRRCRTPGVKAGHPRFKSTNRWHSVSYPHRAGNSWSLNTDTRRLYLKGVGHLRTRLHRALPGVPKTIHVKRENRRWWVIVQCDQVPGRVLPATGRQVGIDLGLTSILTTSDGNRIANPYIMKRAADRLADGHRVVTRTVLGSTRRRKAVDQLKRRHRKVTNCRRDLAHHISKQLVADFDLIVHERLCIPNLVKSARGTMDAPGKGVAQKAGLSKAILDAGWGQLLRFITYKAEEAGRVVIAVAPYYTSQTCSACGHCEAGNRNRARFVCLSCGVRADADENAAVNILRAGLALHRQKCEVREVTESGLPSSLAGPPSRSFLSECAPEAPAFAV